MPPKIFAVILGKENPALEKKAYSEFRRDKRMGAIKTTPVERFRGEPGVWVKSNGVVLDIDEPRLPPTLKVLSAEAVLTRHPLEVQRVNAERLAVMRQLKSMGYKLVSPYYPEMHSEKLLSRLRALAKLVKAGIFARDQAVLHGRLTIEVHPSMLWARDLWAKLGRKRIKRFSASGENEFGDGGRTLPVGSNCSLASSTLRNAPEVRQLMASGHKLYFTEHGEAFNQHLTVRLGRKAYITHEHVDLFAGVAGRVLLVDHAFYQSNKSALKRAASENGLKIVFVPEKERDLHPANFLLLEENKALVDKDAKKQ